MMYYKGLDDVENWSAGVEDVVVYAGMEFC
jgi:hypothetical protein